ncbi:phosphoribosylglycinamide formyltransferase [Isosphaera pallida ATCC 43644]|uniref:Phosphoribosylglycinamide formyltransferase n=1 Tax=Isosphaera pallida (strain ATCC 43644 / DSM 9630 / IS1B) TaxID=575540 RepID=E8QXV3_ISOPI|nr:phosphoribosylglycinamide formyltransferase [Isosphaera pallida]ADV60932.1 phosphoribosylglycinamide formyltransferase [Isosphaera pallida ATCC 43644]
MSHAPRTPPIGPDDPPLRLAACISGAGSTLANLLDRIETGALRAQVVAVVASRPGIGGLEVARRAGIKAVVVRQTANDSVAAYSQQVFAPLRAAGADLVVLAGFLKLLAIPPDYHNKVINVHPSLIPAFCGRGYHGLAVHRAALERGVKLTGCTVHYANDDYDAGPIILQRAVAVLDDDTPETLAARVIQAERIALPQAITLHAQGRLLVEGRRVRVLGNPQSEDHPPP